MSWIIRSHLAEDTEKGFIHGDIYWDNQWFGLTLGLGGVTLVLWSTHQHEHIHLNGPSVLAALAALFGISIGTVYQKQVGKGCNLIAGSFWQYIGMLLLMALMAWSFEPRTAVWTLQLVLSLAWLVCGLSVTAILLLMYMIREGETAKVASYFYLVPPMAAAEAWILFGESLSILSMCAIAVTVVGVYSVVKTPNLHL